MKLSAKVLIVGGGPAGATAARVLASKGVETLLLEKDPSFVKPCGGGLPSGAFAEFGLPESLAKSRITIINIVPPLSEPFQVPIESGYVGIIERGNFDACLRDMAKVEDAAILKGSFLGFLENNRRIIAQAEINGEKAEIHSDFMIAADGVNSRVRAASGFRPVKALFTYSGKFPSDQLQCEFRFGADSRGGYSWVLPSGGKAHIGVGSVEPRNVKKSFDHYLSEKEVKGPPQALRGYRIPLWEPDSKERPLVSGRVLFAGDSAGSVMPFTFEGIYYAMRSGQLASEAIIRERPSEYRRAWRRNFQIRFALMKSLWSHYLLDDRSVEKLLQVIRNRGVQAGAMKLWVEKRSGRGSLVAFITALRKFKLF